MKLLFNSGTLYFKALKKPPLSLIVPTELFGGGIPRRHSGSLFLDDWAVDLEEDLDIITWHDGRYKVEYETSL